jgi:hypothetical protein
MPLLLWSNWRVTTFGFDEREAVIQAEMDVANEDSFVDDSMPDTAKLEKNK